MISIRIPPILLILLCSFASAAILPALEPVETLPVWPGKPLGPSRASGEEHILEGRPRPFYQITDVTTPTLTVYLPAKDHRTGTAVLLCPGGGLQRLAIEHEGFEVAEWLLSQDISVFLLKYRVPAPIGSALLDAQRAMSLIRAQAGHWDVDPDSIGILGFSAGGEIAAWLSTQDRLYTRMDKNDDVSCRPNFAGLVYPGGLMAGRSGGIKNSIVKGIDARTPPMFFAHAFSDSCENSLEMMLALKKAGRPAELHLYQEGGHAFGVRSSGSPLQAWKNQFSLWLRSQGFLDPSYIRLFAQQFADALPGSDPLPRFSQLFPNATLADAYLAQDRLVRQHGLESVSGYKGAGVSAAALTALGIEKPLTGVLFQPGKLSANDRPVVDTATVGQRMVETEIGYIVSVDISYHVLNDTQARGAVEAIVPAIELPANYGSRLGPPTAKDLAASNIGSAQYIVGPRSSPDKVDPNQVQITLERDGAVLHETRGNTAAGGQWANLRKIINDLVDRGYTLRQGDVIISGALGKVQPGELGHYQARFEGLGTIEFELK